MSTVTQMIIGGSCGLLLGIAVLVAAALVTEKLHRGFGTQALLILAFGVIAFLILGAIYLAVTA